MKFPACATASRFLAICASWSSIAAALVGGCPARRPGGGGGRLGEGGRGARGAPAPQPGGRGRRAPGAWGRRQRRRQPPPLPPPLRNVPPPPLVGDLRPDGEPL